MNNVSSMIWENNLCFLLLTRLILSACSTNQEDPFLSESFCFDSCSLGIVWTDITLGSKHDLTSTWHRPPLGGTMLWYTWCCHFWFTGSVSRCHFTSSFNRWHGAKFLCFRFVLHRNPRPSPNVSGLAWRKITVRQCNHMESNNYAVSTEIDTGPPSPISGNECFVT